MSYTHYGKVLQNGVVDMDTIQAPSPGLSIQPEDNGLHITDPHPGDFEWWYFDVYDSTSGCFLKVVVHIGTDPLKTRVFPQLAVSVSTPEGKENFINPCLLGDLEADTKDCNIRIKNEVSVLTESREPLAYHIHIDINRFKCRLRFFSVLEGWKPLGNEVKFQRGRKSGHFSWTIPLPKAAVEGEFTCMGHRYVLRNAIGYHDHNYYRIEKHHPLHLDNLVTSWIWGKAYTDKFTVIFAETCCRANRMKSFMLGEENRIIHSSNHMMECLATGSGYDHTLGSRYPSSLLIRLDAADLSLEAALDLDEISDRKDLLEGLNPVLKWLIKTWIARPVYHGMFARARLRIFGHTWEGFGNYESMIFRNKRNKR